MKLFTSSISKPYLYLIIFFFLALKPNILLAQTVPQKDTVALTFDEFYIRFLKYHPMAKRANLLSAIAKQELRTARGNFDPVLIADWQGKQNKGKELFQYVDPQIKIPTLIGVDIKAGMEQTNGALINPERAKLNEQTQRPENVNYQLFYGGLSLPVLRGLITDVRRAQLNLAKVLINMNEAEQIKELNKLFLNAAKDYWNWQQSFQNFLLMQENLNIAAVRFDFVKNRILSGEEKPIDSIEAIIEYQRREVMLANARLEFLNAGIELSNYLWDENENPLNLAPNVVPSDIGSNIVFVSPDSLANLVNYTREYHPEIIKLGLKVKQYNIERKLAIENLKPQLNLEYYPFQTYTNGSEDIVNGIFTNNYKYGITFYSSLFLRKERGKLGSTTYKLRQSEYDLIQGKKEIVNNVFAAYNELNNIEQLLNIQNSLVNNNFILREAEVFRFENGESSLFLVNQRERALIESQAKLVELKAKYAKSKYQLQWAAGINLFY